MASIDYYEDENQHGNYQYVTLESIVNNFKMGGSSDDYTALEPRHKILYQARRAFRELYFDVMQEIRGIELDLSPTLMVTLPPDFINYVRISWVDENGQLHPMAVDDKMSMAQVYLQDHNYELLFDDGGCVLQSHNTGLDVNDADTQSAEARRKYQICQTFEPNRDFSNVFVNGRVRLNKSEGYIQFGSEVFGKSVVLEYISDGLFTGCEGRPEADLRIHKFAESAVLDYIYYELIKNRRNVPANEKQRARREYFNNRRLAKRRLNTLRKDEMLQVFKGANRWIK